MRAESSLSMLLNVSVLVAQIYFGAQALLLTGAHTDVAGTQHGVAGGALIQFGARGKRVGLRVEGIPPVSLPQAPSATYGQATPQVSLINGALRYALEPTQRWWLGVGATVINQRTPLPNISQVVTSRLAGYRIEALYRAPLNATHFIEVLAGAAPHLAGNDHFDYSIPHASIDKPEIASEEDGMIAFGIVQRNAEWLFGVRSINFSAKFALTGEAGDRNNGAGLLAEYRAFIH
jgi:hypothetical protein